LAIETGEGQQPIMDILAHTLWAGAGLAPLIRRASIKPDVAIATIGLAALLIPLSGWWSHILIDLFIHSADYCALPVLNPITQGGFDGIAWNTPWFMVVNYSSLAVAALFTVKTARSGAARRTCFPNSASVDATPARMQWFPH
jgi:hypothetical protein